MPRPQPRLAAGLVVLAVLAIGCAGSPDEPTAPSSPSAGAKQASPKTGQRNIIGWLVDLGPGTPPGPASGPRLDIYQAVQKKVCLPDLANIRGRRAELKGTSLDLYVGLVAACLAAFRNGGDEEWATAEAGLAAKTGVECLDRPVRDLLTRLVTAHRTHPTWRFEAGAATGAAKRRPSCPQLTGVDPGPGQVGSDVTVRGTNLGEALIYLYPGEDPDGFPADDRDGPSTKWGSPLTVKQPDPWQGDKAVTFVIPDVTSFGSPRNVRIAVAVAVADDDPEVIHSVPFTVDAGT